MPPSGPPIALEALPSAEPCAMALRPNPAQSLHIVLCLLEQSRRPSRLLRPAVHPTVKLVCLHSNTAARSTLHTALDSLMASCGAPARQAPLHRPSTVSRS
eukprot:4432912-Prymnesium_polylepis.1